ncbi:unnamed protein product [Rotaria sordida]|uniref:Uncharacterized protein n=1 Tax=Rotaria sordida TaxID=392033 RepID=A0A819CUF9_9BILA|nr:unnamed protein product [Rotaria sordida]CAF3824809.1 unnamed protein product [Rotaria sordida]
MKLYLLGREYIVQKNHCPLRNMHKKLSNNRRLDRISLALQQYNIKEIRHVSVTACSSNVKLSSKVSQNKRRQINKQEKERHCHQVFSPYHSIYNYDMYFINACTTS